MPLYICLFIHPVMSESCVYSGCVIILLEFEFGEQFVEVAQKSINSPKIDLVRKKMKMIQVEQNNNTRSKASCLQLSSYLFIRPHPVHLIDVKWL